MLDGFSQGSSKSGFVGEVGVDFATFVESTEPFQLSLPLTTSESGAILHVSFSITIYWLCLWGSQYQNIVENY